jgi:uncharacterized membrane protein
MQGAFMKEAAATAKPEVLGKLLPRAMWWFRWGAFWTMASGVTLILINRVQIGSFNNSWGVTIGTGAIMGLIMAANVWFVIHPAQKLVIANAQATASGGAAIPGVAEAAARAGLASRTNTLFSVPMLFFMAASRHLALPVSDSANYTLYWIVALVIIGAIEANGLKGKQGPIESIKGVICCGFLLTLLFMVVMAVVL